MVWSLDDPYGGGLPSKYVFRAIADGVKVAHTRSGGDELFGNYRRFIPFEMARLGRVPPVGAPLRAVVLLLR
jgi:asparagine synthase (glutamine-hydrolysing)